MVTATQPRQISAKPTGAMFSSGSPARHQLKDTEPSPESSLFQLSEATEFHRISCNWSTWPIRNLDGAKRKSSALLRKSKHGQGEI